MCESSDDDESDYDDDITDDVLNEVAKVTPNEEKQRKKVVLKKSISGQVGPNTKCKKRVTTTVLGPNSTETSAKRFRIAQA